MSLPIPFESLLPPASKSHIATRSSLWSEALQFIAYVSKILQKSRETASAEKNTLFLHVDEFGMQRNIVGQGAQSKVLIAGGYGANNEGSTPSFSKYALKTTLPSKREDGEVDYMALRRTRFHNALAEIRVLTCPPLATHQSIVNFLGVAWENDEEVGSDQSVHPSIAIERAEMGSLSEYLNTRSGASGQLDYEVKRSLALCVALGLDVLHESGIVHGDVKPDNVLVFVDTKMPGGVRAKLTDFGHSVFIHKNGDLENSKEAKEFIAPLGTRDWNAPEIRPKVDTTSSQSIYLSANEIVLTDIYSFGLLYWSLLLNGADCFDCIPGVQQAVTAKDLTTRSRLIEQNMEGNFMKHWAYTSVKSFGTWQGSDKDAIYKEEAGHIFDWTLDSLLEERANQLGKLFVSFPDTALQRKQELLRFFNRSDFEHVFRERAPKRVDSLEDYPDLSDLLDHRNWFDRGNIGVRQLVTSAFESEEREVEHASNNRSLICYNLALCYLYGFGTPKDIGKANDLLDEAAGLNHENAKKFKAAAFVPGKPPKYIASNDELSKGWKDLIDAQYAYSETEFKRPTLSGNGFSEATRDRREAPLTALDREVDGVNDVLWWVPADPRIKDLLMELVPKDGIDISNPGTYVQPDSALICPVTSLDLAIQDSDLETIEVLISKGAVVKFRMIYQAALRYNSDPLSVLVGSLVLEDRNDKRLSERVLLDQLAKTGDGEVQRVLRHGTASPYHFSRTMAIIQGLNHNISLDIIPGMENLNSDNSSLQGVKRFGLSLLEACQCGDLSLVGYILGKPYVQHILASKSRPDVQEFNRFVLLDVINRGDREVYKLLIKYGISPKDTKSGFISRALSICSKIPGRIFFLQDLFQRSPWPELSDRVEYNDENEELFWTQANKSVENDAEGDFFSAILYRNWEVATFLLAQSNDCLKTQRYALNAMMAAKSFLSMPQIKYLLNEKPYPTNVQNPLPGAEFIMHRQRGLSILHGLCIGGYKEGKYLPVISDVDLRQIAHYVTRKFNGPELNVAAVMPPLPPLMTAVLYGNKPVAETLLNYATLDAFQTVQRQLSEINALDLGRMICMHSPRDVYNPLEHPLSRVSNELWKKSYDQYLKDVDDICTMLVHRGLQPVQTRSLP